MLYSAMRRACLVVVGVAAMAAQPSAGPRGEWDLAQMATLDSRDGWTGPDPEALRLDSERVEGEASLCASFLVDRGRHLRLERNFISGYSGGLDNMMGMGMEVEDFTPYRTIRFAFRTEWSGPGRLLFRIYDRTGGWLDWTVPEAETAREWRRVSLAVPAAPGEGVNLRAIGGVLFEIQAPDAPVSGRIWIDDLQFVSDCAPGLTVNARPAPRHDYTQEPLPLKIPNDFPKREVHIVLNVSALEIALWQCDASQAIRQLQEELRRFQGIENLEIYINPGTREPVDRDPKYLPAVESTLVEVARWCEANRLRFYQNMGFEGHGFLPEEIMFAVLDAAPEYCLGFIFAECSVETNNHIDYTVRLLERCREQGKKVLYFQQSSYWLGIMQPHGREFVERVLDPRYKDIFVPMWENLLPSSPGLCFATTLGLWYGGLTSAWGVSAQSWGYTNMNYGGTSDMPGHWWFRMFLECVAAGATYIEIEPLWALDGENTEAQIRHAKQWAHNLVWIGQMRPQVEIDLRPSDRMMALRYFDQLISAGVARPPAEPAHAVSIPKLALRVEHTDNSYTWGVMRRALDTNWWPMGDCPNCWEMSAQVPADEMFRYVYNSSHFYDQTVPETPFGLVAVVPGNARVPEGVETLPTDGYGIRLSDEWLEPKPSSRAVAEAYEKAAEALPFRAKGCYISVAQVGPDAYLAYLIDPEERFPVGVDTTVEIGLPGEWTREDALTQMPLPVEAGRVPVRIPPADCRVLLLERRGAWIEEAPSAARLTTK